MKIKSLILAASLIALSLCVQSCDPSPTLPPDEGDLQYATQAQKDWMALKYGMFIHFGPNTYQMKAWGDGTYPAGNLNFANVDMKQWAETATAAGMKYAVLTAKHHDGFCLWNSAYTDYCMKSTITPTVDVVAEFVTEFRNAGLKVGLYYSLWDRNNPIYYDGDDTKYITYMKNQLTELLTNYGEITEIWFDGAWDRDYPHACQNAELMALIGEPVRAINDPANPHTLCWIYNELYRVVSPESINGQRWSWTEVYDLIHRLQPNCLVINNASMNWKGGAKYLPLDARPVEQFDFVAPAAFIPSYDETSKFVYTNEAGSKVYLPLEYTTSITPSWFWTGDILIHPSVDEIVGWFVTAQANHGNLLLNVGPGMDGKIPSYNVDYLTRAGTILKNAGMLK